MLTFQVCSTKAQKISKANYPVLNSSKNEQKSWILVAWYTRIFVRFLQELRTRKFAFEIY